MEFKAPRDMLFSDTIVPDVFICDIMPSLPSDCVKVYIYGLFLCKHNKKAEPNEIAEKLGFSTDTLNAALIHLENENLRSVNCPGFTAENMLLRLTKHFQTHNSISAGTSAYSQ